MSKEIVTTISVYFEGSKQDIDQPGFYLRLRELIGEFTDVGLPIISIEEEEVNW